MADAPRHTSPVRFTSSPTLQRNGGQSISAPFFAGQPTQICALGRARNASILPGQAVQSPPFSSAAAMTIAPGVLYPSVVLVDLVNTAFLASKEKVQPGPDPTVAIPPALAM